MNIITVIPLSRAKVADTLSYFTAQDVPIGAIVAVPLRSKSIHAIVTEVRPVQDLKTEIRQAPFEIRKLGKVKATAFFPATFLDSCKLLADYYATTPGAIIDALVADILLANAHKIPPPLPTQNSLWNEQRPFSKKSMGEVYAVQADTSDRHSTWRSLIRQRFAQTKSIVIYAPSIEDTRNLFASLEKGIEGYIFLLHTQMPPKKLLETWNKIAETTHPVVIVATGSFPLFPRSDIDTIIIERENGRGWVTQKNPYMDLRFALETYHYAERRNVYVSDSLLRVETLHRLSEHSISEGSPFKWRSVSTAKDELIDMKEYKAVENNFRIVSPELEGLIRENRNNSTHLFILTTRRGIAPSTVCADCETIVSCGTCRSPVVLHTSKESGRNFFMCHTCGERRTADENCVVCGGWRLTPLGIGIERVETDIRERFPDMDIFKIDADSTATPDKVAEVIKKFLARPGSILLGTEMALSYLPEKLDFIAIASLDSLLALPDFRIEEKIMYILIRLRNMATRSILVQTRRVEEKVFEFGLKGNLSDFYRYVNDQRKHYSYPPFGALLKISIEGKKELIAQDMAKIQKLIDPHIIDIFPAFTFSVRGNSIIHGLIKMETHQWPDLSLVEKLRALPPNVNVKVNPESLL